MCSWHCQLADMPDICKQMFLLGIFSLSMFFFHLNLHLFHSYETHTCELVDWLWMINFAREIHPQIIAPIVL